MNPSQEHKSEEEEAKSNVSTARGFMKYSGLAFQLAILITIGVLAGKWLDTKFEMSKPIFTAVCSLFATIGGMYSAIKGLVKK